MSKLSSKTSQFFYQNRNKGIPNLMLYIAIGNVVVYLLSRLNPTDLLFYDLLRFSFEDVLHLQLWRLITFPLTYLTSVAYGSAFGVLLGAISLFFYYYCGKVIEANWGTLRFNCYYLAGILLMDAAALIIGLVGRVSFPASASYLNLSLFLAVATLQPEAGVRLYFVIPLKMKWLAWFELALTAYQVVTLIIFHGVFSFVWLMPIFAILNYFLFFGKGFLYVLPDFMRNRKTSAQRQTAQRFRAATQTRGPVHTQPSYRFRCTVCGRTDVSHPKLEFRYCSRCAGYRCYCIDHINNHAHITD